MKDSIDLRNIAKKRWYIGCFFLVLSVICTVFLILLWVIIPIFSTPEIFFDGFLRKIILFFCILWVFHISIIVIFVFIWCFESLRAIEKPKMKWNKGTQKSKKIVLKLYPVFTTFIALFILLRIIEMPDLFGISFFLFIPTIFFIIGGIFFLTSRVSTTWEVEEHFLLIKERCLFHEVLVTVCLSRLELIKIPKRLDYATILCGTERIEFWYKNTLNFSPDLVTCSIPRKNPLYSISFLIRFLEQFPEIQIKIDLPYIYKKLKLSHFLEKTDFKVSDWLKQHKSFITNLPLIVDSSSYTLADFIKDLTVLPRYYATSVGNESNLLLSGINQKTEILFRNKRFQKVSHFGLLISGILIILGLLAIFSSLMFPDSPILNILFVPNIRRDLEFPPLYFFLYGILYIFLGLIISYHLISRIVASKLPVIQFDPKKFRIGRKYHLKGIIWEIELYYSILCDIRENQNYKDPKILVVNLVTVIGEFPFLSISKDEFQQVKLELNSIFAYYNQVIL